jgi:transposase-like protein/transposase Tn5 family protein
LERLTRLHAGGDGLERLLSELSPLQSYSLPTGSPDMYEPVCHSVRRTTMRSTLQPHHVSLGSIRLDQRFLKIVDCLARNPEATIPEAAGSKAATKATYRFFDNPAVNPDDIRGALRYEALDCLPLSGPILCVQDTTSLDFTTHPATTGLGYLDHPARLGMFLHTTLAVTSDGVPCGVIHQKSWTRDSGTLGKSKLRYTKATTEKESQRWIDSLQITEAALPADRQVITIADREADIYDLFAQPRRSGSHLLIRVKPKRSVRHPERLLGPAVRSVPPCGTMEVDLKRGDNRPARRAVLTLRFLKLDVAPPANRRGRKALPHVTVTAILAEEANPPAGHKPVRWWLVTTLAVETLADARRMVLWYTWRWLIERYHFVLKSGCHVERLQLAKARRLERAVATYAAVAWRLLWLTYEARRHPDQSCEPVLSRTEWKVLDLAMKAREKRPAEPRPAIAEEPPSLREAVRKIAQLGGFLGRKGDGEPGVKTLWRGIRRLDDMVAGYMMHSTHTSLEAVGNE